MFLLKKIKASALQMVLVVAVIIVILLFAFISLMYYQKRVAIKHANYSKSIYENHQVFDYLNQTDIPYGLTDSLDIFSNVSITKKQWGIFELVSVKTKKNKESFEQIALIGERNIHKRALYLKNNNQQLILVGNTIIKGNVALPRLRVNSGNIAGISYNKDRLIYGDIAQSEEKLPAIKNTEKVYSFLTSYLNDSIKSFDLEEGANKHWSFTKKTLVHRRNGVVDIVHSNLYGHIIIESDTLIRVHSSSQLQDVILIAPRIEILPNFKGSLQVFATDTIKIGENSQLAYPTSLMLLDNKNKGTIQISKSSTIKGIISYLSNSETTSHTSQILLDNTSVVFGEVYCQGNIELRGQVNGAIYTNGFIVNQFGGIFINHIFNGGINSDKLTKEYAGLFLSDSFKSVAKWLN